LGVHAARLRGVLASNRALRRLAFGFQLPGVGREIVGAAAVPIQTAKREMNAVMRAFMEGIFFPVPLLAITVALVTGVALEGLAVIRAVSRRILVSTCQDSGKARAGHDRVLKMRSRGRRVCWKRGWES